MFPDNGDLKEGDAGYIGPRDPKCITRKVDEDTTRLEPAYDVRVGEVVDLTFASTQAKVNV